MHYTLNCDQCQITVEETSMSRDLKYCPQCGQKASVISENAFKNSDAESEETENKDSLSTESSAKE